MTTDPTPLQERIARAVWEYEAGPSGIPWERFAVRCPEVAAERMRNAAPVLPIIAAEVQAAKAEAWNECVRAAYTPEGRITHGPNPYETGGQA